MNWISNEFIKENINYPELIEALEMAFRLNTIQCPPKQTYDYKSTNSNEDNTLLFMPSWDNESHFGVKLITATPNNKPDIPYLNGLYLLFNAENGLPLVVMDAKLITNMRTAATSVLASHFLAKNQASKVLIIGNGSLSPFYIKAYASKQNINTIYIWGRNHEKSKQVVKKLGDCSVKVEAIENFEPFIKEVDIVSCITSSHDPILYKGHISSGQHFDLAGSYAENMHEVSEDVVAACSIYTDNFDVTLKHAGELVKALKENKINISDIKGDLRFLCKDNISKRNSDEENTLFKCTGMAIEDLVIAKLVYDKYTK
ncbi:ornithine cyclodeaminase family protein [Sinomicrobium oceani]|uniref:ornithine cyclodeaminase family protein n=1 Tax=Sinomicrobium oceani TaxID=1150368 RepID=UPI00227B45B8|nr:hypothetical protein [Sinomicrobium oceani]